MGGSEAADWIAAIGQAVGAIGTFAAVVVALLIARRDGRRLEEDRREREASQARLITTRVDEDWQEIVDGAASQLVVRNNSDHAIADLYVVEVQVDGRNLKWFPEESAIVGVDVVAPGSSATFDGRWEGPQGPGTGSSEGKVDAVNARVQFADSSGVWWQRVGNNVIRSATPVARGATSPTWKNIHDVRTATSPGPRVGVSERELHAER